MPYLAYAWHATVATQCSSSLFSSYLFGFVYITCAGTRAYVMHMYAFQGAMMWFGNSARSHSRDGQTRGKYELFLRTFFSTSSFSDAD